MTHESRCLDVGCDAVYQIGHYEDATFSALSLLTIGLFAAWRYWSSKKEGGERQ